MRLLFDDQFGQWLLDPCGNATPTEGGVVVWDERTDGPLPKDFDAALVGGYVRKENELVHDQGTHDKNTQLKGDHAAGQDAEAETLRKAQSMAHLPSGLLGTINETRVAAKLDPITADDLVTAKADVKPDINPQPMPVVRP